jgi:hypothetical protein
MTLPSRLPMSLEGSNFLPMLKSVIQSFTSGSMKPKPSSIAVAGRSMIWRRMRRIVAKTDCVLVGAVVEVVMIAELCDLESCLSPIVFLRPEWSIVNR